MNKPVARVAKILERVFIVLVLFYSERRPFGSEKCFAFSPEELHATQEKRPSREKSRRAALGYGCARLKTKGLTILPIRPTGGEAPSARCGIEIGPSGSADSSHVKKSTALRDNC